MSTHAKLIASSLAKVQHKKFYENEWGYRHYDEWMMAITRQNSIVPIVRALADYADRYYRMYESRLGDDAVLGAAWEQMMQGTRTLLNGEIGQLDAGTMDGLLCDMLKLEGFQA